MKTPERQNQASFPPDFSQLDELFQEPNPLIGQGQEFEAEINSALPQWIDETRLVCFICGILGLVITITNLDFFYYQIKNPFVTNLTLLAALAGFLNYMIFPYLLKYTLINGTSNSQLLRPLNGWIFVFSAALLLFLLAIPISGLGLALVLIPAPLTFALYTKKYAHEFIPSHKSNHPFLVIFDQDLHKLAWYSFILIFISLFAIFGGLLFGLL